MKQHYWFYEKPEGADEPRPLTLRSLMTPKPHTLTTTDLVMDAMRVLKERVIRHVPVISERENKIVGVVSETDLLKNVLHGKTMTTDEQYHATLDMMLPLSEVMSTHVYSLTPDAPVLEAVKLFLREKIRCVPVVEPDGTVAGIVTETDLMHLLEHMIDE